MQSSSNDNNGTNSLVNGGENGSTEMDRFSPKTVKLPAVPRNQAVAMHRQRQGSTSKSSNGRRIVINSSKRNIVENKTISKNDSSRDGSSSLPGQVSEDESDDESDDEDSYGRPKEDSVHSKVSSDTFLHFKSGITPKQFSSSLQRIKGTRAVNLIGGSKFQLLRQQRTHEGVILNQSPYPVTPLPWTRWCKTRGRKQNKTKQVTLFYLCFMTILTLLSLLCGDIQLAYGAKSGDIGFTILHVLIAVTFLCDMILFIWFYEDYAKTMFFKFDLLSLLSIIVEFRFVWNRNHKEYIDVPFEADSGIQMNFNDYSGLIWVRVIRIIRIVKILKAKECFRLLSTLGYNPFSPSSDMEVGSGSGYTLALRTFRNTFSIIMLLLLLRPFLTFDVVDKSGEYGLSKVYENSLFPDSEVLYNHTVNVYMQFLGDDLLYFREKGIDVIHNTRRLSELREVEVLHMSINAPGGSAFYSIVDKKQAVEKAAVYSIYVTLLTVIFVILGHRYVRVTVEKAIVNPIRNMIKVVTQLGINPLTKLENPRKEEAIKVLECCGCWSSESSHDSLEVAEISILESTFLKLGGLLQVGFGEAGAEIIAACVQGNEMDAMVPGNKVKAIFGFSDIRHFADATRALEEKVMIFVNQIAYIVHKHCHRFSGKPNKNIGEAFLLVWKPDKKTGNDVHYTIRSPGQALEETKESQWKDLAENALHSYISTMEDLSQSDELKSWAQDPRLKLTNPNYKVELGFGFHIGWAVEGPIGSEEKIDASYLSPNVNLASRLDAANKQYGTTLLMSGDFVELLSEDVRNLCRRVDRVTVKGSKLPMDLYTVDLFYRSNFRSTIDSLSVRLDTLMGIRRRSRGSDSRTSASMTRDRISDSIPDKRLTSESRSKHNSDVSDNEVLMAGDYDEDDEDAEMDLVDRIRSLQIGLPKGFLRRFNEGVDLYVSGDWKQASELLQQCLDMKRQDKPCQVLLGFMREHKCVAPLNWEGYRSLTSK